MQGADGVLLGAGLGWLEGLIPFLFVLIWIVSNVVGAIRKAAKPVDPQAAGRPLQVRQGRPPELDREIEELLRRTIRGESPPQPINQAPVQSAKEQRPQKAKKVMAGAPPQISRQISRTSTGSDVARHVQEAFSQDLAHASPSGTARAAAAVAAASPPIDLIAALRSPEDLRQLVIVREILDVPSHRW